MTRSRVRPGVVPVWLVVLALLAAGPMAAAQDQPAENAPAQPEAIELTATVLAVTGLVQVREAADQPWKRAEPGAKVGMGAEFRTGMRSAVRFVIPPDQVVTLDRLTTMKVLTAAKTADGKVATNLGMKYGRTRYQIEAGGGVEHQTSISSPSAVLAVRGSDVTYNDDALGAYAFGSGRLAFMDNINRRVVQFGGQTVADVSSQFGSAADNALNQTTSADPKSTLRDDIEQTILQQYLAQGGIDNQSFQFVKKLVSEQTFAASLQVTGSLIFILNWQTGFPSTNLDLRVTSPAGDTITSANDPSNPTVTGGVFDAAGDQAAGFFPPLSPQATESAGWLVAAPLGSCPPGTHTVTAVLQDGAQPGFAMLTVLQDFVPGAPNFLTLNQQVDGKPAAIVQIEVK